jgi:glyoxylase-like metal-dependent hydrolase (beta-lactamase superfamily II)
MQVITEHFRLIDTEALGGRQSVAAYLVEGEVAALVDMGYASSVEVVERELSLLRSDCPLRYLVPTHIHLDHAGSVGLLAERYPDSVVVVQNRGAVHLLNPSRLVDSVKRTYGEDLVRKMGVVHAVFENQLRLASDQDRLDLGSGVALDLTWAPGHAPHQMIVFEPSTGVMITGDAAGMRYPELPILIPTTPPPSFDPELTIETLQRIKRMGPRLLLIPHFGVAEDVDFLIDGTMERVLEWKELIGPLVANGKTVDDVYRVLVQWASVEAGTQSSMLPDYVRLSLRTNALGLWNYFDRTKRVHLRPQ